MDVNSSKNAGVALLCASLINRGTTTLRRLARIEEVNRIVEVLTSIGVECTWLNANDLQIRRPAVLDLAAMDVEAARRTRSVIMLLGPLLDQEAELPPALRRRLRPRHPHGGAAHAGAARSSAFPWTAHSGFYAVQAPRSRTPGTAPSCSPNAGTPSRKTPSWPPRTASGTTVIRNASPNYMVQDLCFYLQGLGVGVDGVGTTTLTIRGRARDRRGHGVLRRPRTRSRR